MTPQSDQGEISAQIDEMLDEWGFSSKPGSQKGRMYSSRFYHVELKKQILQLFQIAITEAKREMVPKRYLEILNTPDLKFAQGWNACRKDVLTKLTNEIAREKES
jgi:hypothetical protein